MEVLVQTKPWRHVREQLEVCERKICAAAAEMDDLSRNICKTMESESIPQIRRTLQKRQESLYRQAGILADMGKVLEMAWHRYERCEDRIIQTVETDGRLFEETLATAEFSHFDQIKVSLE